MRNRYVAHILGLIAEPLNLRYRSFTELQLRLEDSGINRAEPTIRLSDVL